MSHLSPIPHMRVGTRAVGVVACRRRVTSGNLFVTLEGTPGALRVLRRLEALKAPGVPSSVTNRFPDVPMLPCGFQRHGSSELISRKKMSYHSRSACSLAVSNIWQWWIAGCCGVDICCLLIRVVGDGSRFPRYHNQFEIVASPPFQRYSVLPPSVS